MGSDEIGTSQNTLPNLEENSLISTLCDLIERIWSHATYDDYENKGQLTSNKCPFWVHLNAFHEQQQNCFRNGEGSSHHDSLSNGSQSPESVSGVNWTSIKKRIDCNQSVKLTKNNIWHIFQRFLRFHPNKTDTCLRIMIQSPRLCHQHYLTTTDRFVKCRTSKLKLAKVELSYGYHSKESC